MTQTSNRGYVERIDDDFFAEDEPADCAHAWLLRNNLLHLRDMFAQVRAFGQMAGGEVVIVGLTPEDSEVSVWGKPFLHTWLAEDTPTNLYCGAAFTATTAVTGTIRLRVVPHYAPGTTKPTRIGDLSLPALVDQSFAVTADTFITSGALPYIFDPAAVRALNLRPTSFQGRAVEDGAAVTPQIHVMRLDAVIRATPAYLSYQAGHLVREFV